MSDITLDVAEQALNCVPAHERETWVAMAMALKSEFGDAAFDVWDGWSQSDESYKAGDARAVWRSVKPGGKTGIGTLIHEAQRGGFELRPQTLSDDERRQRATEVEQRRQRVEAERRAYEQAEQAWYERVADAAQFIWDELLQDNGVSEYIGKKRIQPLGVRFVASSFIYVADLANEQVDVITGSDRIREFFRTSKALDPEQLSFRYCKRGTFAVPMRDVHGKLWNLQLIFPSGKKRFLKHGRKQGFFHQIDGISIDTEQHVLLLAEGYATGASVHMATGRPVAVCFDAGNLKPVAKALRPLYPDKLLVFVADDDRQTEGNPGITKANQAAQAVGGHVWVPDFTCVGDRAKEARCD